MEMKNCNHLEPQFRLIKAFDNRNIGEFCAALELGADPLAKDSDFLSVFEKALQTPGCSEYVKECLKIGCDPNYVNPDLNTTFIFNAAKSHDPQTLKVFLIKPGVKVDIKSKGLTALNYLAKSLDSNNAKDVLECIHILLQHGASPNIGDEEGSVPLHYILNNHAINELQKLDFIKLFVSRSDLNIDILDIFRLGDFITKLKEKYPNLNLPERQESHVVNYIKLSSHIQNNEMLHFEQYFRQHSSNIADEDKLQLLIESIECGAQLAFDLFLENGIACTESYKCSYKPIETSWANGNWYALKKLLEQQCYYFHSKDPPFCWMIKKLNEKPLQEFCDYWKCFHVLLDSDRVDINKCDASGTTALHYAAKYRNTEAIRELLKRGANLCTQSSNKNLAIEKISPKLLEEHFNECITSNGFELGDEHYAIFFDYKNIWDDEKSMLPIAFMAKSKMYCHLLLHPLITSYLYLKWQKVAYSFYINFVLFILYALSIITYAVLKFKEKDYVTAIAISAVLSWLGIIYLIIREIIQSLVFRFQYFKSLINYMEIVLIVLSIMTCMDPSNFDNKTQRILAIFTISLVAVEMYLLVASLPVPSISTHVLMLEAVCKSFFKSFLLYSVFIIMFTLSFYIMHDDPQKGDNPFNSFPNLIAGFSKTIVMLTGELDASNLELETPYSQFIFLLFVFFMTIILFNLLNGIAVSGTQAIQDQGDLNYILCRVHFLTHWEKRSYESAKLYSLYNYYVYNGSFLYRSYICVMMSLYKVLSWVRTLDDDYSEYPQIGILPNARNRIFEPILKSSKSSEANPYDENEVLTYDKRRILENATYCFSYITSSSSEMDERIAKSAMNVLEQKSEETIENRLNNIEKRLEQMFAHMQRKEI